MPVTEAVFENGVLKPLVAEGLKEHWHYRLTWEEADAIKASNGGQLTLPAHLAHRLDVLSDGRRVIRFCGARIDSLADWPEDFDPVSVALQEIREEQNRLREEEWDEFYSEERQP
ncbi:MAG: hypothetical protein HOP19_21215 [Acidobacteria bacterium]|nr:hypothetical protein [Acidobacteriota bacterium]